MNRPAIKILFLLMTALILTASLTAQNQSNAAPQISKIEPPNWWANQTINPVRLLVRGANFRAAKVISANKSLKVSNVRVNPNATYLFFDVTIAPDAKPAKYEFEVSTAGGKTKTPFEISAPLDAKTNFQSITNDDVIYLIMTDRFADGDAANDNPPNSPALANDRNNPRAWHGGDFKGIANKIPYLKELGVTAIWLTPWYDNSDDVTTCDKPWCPMTSYHGYGATDYYAVENHFGTFADLREMIETAHRNGIKVIQDQVANHVGINHPWIKNPPLADWFPPFTQNTFNSSVLLSPNGSQVERDNLLHGWFDFSLPDINQDEPEVAKYEIQNALWWIAATGIDGIRQDTIQYMPRPFIRDWSSAILKQYPKFYMVGEVFVRDSVHTAFFQGGKTAWDGVDTKLPSDFDFNLWQTSLDVFTGKKPLTALRDVLKYDGLYANVNNITTLQNNHDTDRFMSLPGATKEGAKLHLAFLLATRGIPQLYYGEEILMNGGFDPENRRDFPGGWQGDKTDKFLKAGRTADEQEMFEWTQKFIKLRKENRALREGKTIDLFYDNDAYLFGRYFEENKSLRHRENNYAVFGINLSEKMKIISLSPMKFAELDKLEDILDEQNQRNNFLLPRKAQVSKDAKGNIILEMPAKSIITFESNISVIKEN